MSILGNSFSFFVCVLFPIHFLAFVLFYGASSVLLIQLMIFVPLETELYILFIFGNGKQRPWVLKSGASSWVLDSVQTLDCEIAKFQVVWLLQFVQFKSFTVDDLSGNFPDTGLQQSTDIIVVQRMLLLPGGRHWRWQVLRLGATMPPHN